MKQPVITKGKPNYGTLPKSAKDSLCHTILDVINKRIIEKRKEESNNG